MDWNDLKYFIGVAKTGNVTQASEQMQVSAATMTRHIEHLEHALDVRLFHRRQTGYVLTEAGEDLLPLAENVAADARFLERRASPLGASPILRIKIELPEVLGAYIIVPGLAKAGALDAPFRLEIVNAAESTRLSARSSDIVVRLKRPDFGGYTARKIGSLSRAIYCSQSYLSAKNTQTSQIDLSTLDLIGWTDRLGYLPTARWFRDVTGQRPLWFQASNVRLQIDAVVAGLGATVLPKFIADAHGLVRIKALETEERASDIWLLRNQETQGLGDVDLVIEWIVKSIRDAKHSLLFSAKNAPEKDAAN